ncbi:vitamin H transporter [Aspergillus venezuelensis]
MCEKADKAPATNASMGEDLDEGEGTVVVDWSTEEESSVVRRIDWVLLPALIAANFMVEIDRGNLSNSLTSTITQDLNITRDQINVASQLFLVGVVIFELPSNILMQIFSPHLWLSAQIFIWGTVETFQSFIQIYGALLATRFLLGLFEAGFEPGGIYLLTMWYKRSEFATRIALYYMGKLLANALQGLLAAGILNLAGVAGWGGWRWLWLIEGIMTLFVAVVFLLILPRSIRNPSPVISFNRWTYFKERERHILLSRLGFSSESANNERPRREKFSWKEFFVMFKDSKLWLHIAITMLSACALHGLTLYTPSMIKSFNFSTIHSNALSSVAYFGAMAMCGTLAYLSDRTQQRGLFTLLSATWSLISWGCLLTVANLTNKWHKFVLLMLSNFCGVTTHVLNSATRSVMTIAVNLGGLSGGQIFSEKYAPTYNHSIMDMTAIAAGAWVVAVGLVVLYFFLERRGRL